MIYDDYVEYTNKYRNIYGEKTIVFIEIGSFFEIYGVNNDNEVSGANMIEMGNLLNIQVSRKNKSILENSRDNPMMAGFPNHSLKKFIDILINNNYTNVIIEQVTPPPNPKREVTQIISPSTYIENLSSHKANILLILYIELIENWKTKKTSFGLGVSTVDLSTSRTTTTELYIDRHTLNEELVRLCLFFNPKELVICCTTGIEIFVPTNVYFHDKIGKLNDQYLNKTYQTSVINKIFTEKGFLEPIEYINLERKPLSLVSFVYMLDFVYGHNEKLLRNISKPIIEHYDDNLILTNNALYQLDIIGKTNCLMDILNNCQTSIGKRYFNRMITNPITHIDKLNTMYSKVEYYISNNLYVNVRQILKHIMDFERIIKRPNIQPFQLVNVYTSLLQIAKLYKLIKNKNILASVIKNIEKDIKIEKASKYNLNNIDENIFCLSYNKELDHLQSQLEDIVNFFKTAHSKISDYVKLERSDKDGIIFTTTNKKFNDLNKINKCFVSIKYKHNHVRVFDKEIESKNIEYLSVKNAIRTTVSDLFTSYCNEFLKKYINELDDSISCLEEVDYYSTNAYNAVRFGYYKPSITGDKCHIDSKQLRHPIIEYVQKDTKYIPNDICINEENRGIILYGINAAGKSSLMKSLGISVLMAQCGMYVPAKEYSFYPYTSIHTRILNNDNLYKKQSTFTVEMSEIRNILNNSNSSSLVIGDELCSGTESVSAISLVTAGVMHLAKNDTSFIFATHLHELSKIEEIQTLSNVNIKHLSVNYDPLDNLIIYDRILKEGSGDTLYGLEVCKSLDLDPIFMLTANKIRKKLLDMSENIVHNKKSVYNSTILKDVCYICKKRAEDVHHIEHQANADENNMIDHYHKNSAFNLVALCKTCHDNTHNGSITIDGFQSTTKGKKLKYHKKENMITI